MAKYEVLTETLGANPTYSKGDTIEDSGPLKAPYDFDWLVRMGAIKPAADREADRPALAAQPAAADVTISAPAAQIEMQPASAGEASAGHHAMLNLDMLDAEQQSALGKAGFDSAEKIRAASDDDLLKVEGIGPATLRKIREATQA